ncbi:MAG: Fe-S cluster assembly ATPase SufC [Schwartzia sp.]|nr:Fe-S cluster assembly ATPase SufC [Schwartzia sp. (in: firmicutes)]
MGENILKILGLRAGVDGKEILHGVDLSVGKGETHVLLGPNGSGKTTLMNVLMGHPRYEVYAGDAAFEGEELLALPTHERARRGLFLSFQTPEEIPGVTVENMLRTARQAITGKKAGVMAFRKELAAALETLKMDKDWAGRYLNVGFSGGEKKRTEILQLLMLKPKLALLDETDSGLDVDAARIVSNGVKAFRTPENACLIITHNANILSALSVDRAHVLLNGRIVKSGGAELVGEIEANGYARFLGAEG